MIISTRSIPVFAVGLAVLTLGLTGCAAAHPPSAASSAESGSSSAPAPSSSGGSGTATANEIDACSLVTTAEAATLTGKPFTQADSSTIADGQDQCVFGDTAGDSMTVIIYQGTSGVTWNMLADVLGNSSTPTPVSGVGDRAMVGAIELDVQAGKRLIALEGGLDIATSGPPLAKALVAALG